MRSAYAEFPKNPRFHICVVSGLKEPQIPRQEQMGFQFVRGTSGDLEKTSHLPIRSATAPFRNVRADRGGRTPQLAREPMFLLSDNYASPHRQSTSARAPLSNS